MASFQHIEDIDTATEGLDYLLTLEPCTSGIRNRNWTQKTSLGTKIYLSDYSVCIILFDCFTVFYDDLLFSYSLRTSGLQ